MAIMWNEMQMATYEELKVKYEKSLLLKKFSLRHPRYDFSATLRSLSEQPFNFTMHYNGHRESTYVSDNRSNTLPNTYPELAQCQGSSCRLLRHSKIYAQVHSLKGNYTLPRVHWPNGTQSVKKSHGYHI